MKLCEQTMNAILEDAVLTPAQKEHLKECRECRVLAELSRRIDELPADSPEIPESLDRAVRTAARGRFRLIVLPRMMKFTLPLAAAFVFGCALLYYCASGLPGAGNPVRTGGTAAEAGGEICASGTETSFDERLFALSADVGSGMNTVSETLDMFI